MKANLDNDGTLIAPRNVERGRVRLKQLDHEIKKLASQVSPGETGPRANCLGYLNDERVKLVQWIEDHEHEEKRS